MLFLVISNPVPSRPQDAKNARQEFRSWIKGPAVKKQSNILLSESGQGLYCDFNVSSNDELHALMTQWLDIVPASFDISFSNSIGNRKTFNIDIATV